MRKYRVVEVEVERTWWVSAYPLSSLQRNGRQSPKVETTEIDNPCGGKPREPVSSKAGRKSEAVGAFQVHSRETRIIRTLTP